MSRAAPSPGRTAVYRLRDARGTLLYVGLSHCPRDRYLQHEADKLWRPDVQGRSETWFDTRDEAEAAERVAIGSEAPLYNRTDETGAVRAPRIDPGASDRVEEKLAALSALEGDLQAGSFARHRFLPSPAQLGRRYGYAARDLQEALDALESRGLVKRVSCNRYVAIHPGRSVETTGRGLMLQEILAGGLDLAPFTRRDVRNLTGRSPFVVDLHIGKLVEEGRLQMVGRRVPVSGGRPAEHFAAAPSSVAEPRTRPRQRGVILFGPPASGKDTVTAALAELAPQYQQFARLKVGSGKSAGYRMGTAEQLRALEAAGDVVYANSRYGNTYAIDRPGLDTAFTAGVPVVHLGQIDGIHTLIDGYPAEWVLVLLWCPREVTKQRSAGRGDSDTAARLSAWDATREDLDAHPGVVWDLTVDTTASAPPDAARLIDQLLARRAGAASA